MKFVFDSVLFAHKFRPILQEEPMQDQDFALQKVRVPRREGVCDVLVGDGVITRVEM